MTILIFIVGFLLVLFASRMDRAGHNVMPGVFCGFGVVLIASSFLLGFNCLLKIVSEIDIDERLFIYEEQQAEIENQVSLVIESYKDYENIMFDRPDTYNPMILISTYPELKTDTLMQKQCDLYIANNQKICELKEEKIKLQRYKYLLYFGK